MDRRQFAGTAAAALTGTAVGRDTNRDEALMREVGRRLRLAREAKGLSIEQAAIAANMDTNRWPLFELGGFACLGCIEGIQILKSLDMTLEQFYDGLER